MLMHDSYQIPYNTDKKLPKLKDTYNENDDPP